MQGTGMAASVSNSSTSLFAEIDFVMFQTSVSRYQPAIAHQLGSPPGNRPDRNLVNIPFPFLEVLPASQKCCASSCTPKEGVMEACWNWWNFHLVLNPRMPQSQLPSKTRKHKDPCAAFLGWGRVSFWKHRNHINISINYLTTWVTAQAEEEMGPNHNPPLFVNQVEN